MNKKILVLIALLTITTQPTHAEVYVQAVDVLINGNAKIIAGSYSSYNLTLKKGEELVVELKVTGGLNDSLTVWLLDLTNFQRYEAGQQYSYFKGSSGEINSSSRYRFAVPMTNIYYLVLDNKKAVMAPRQVHSYVYKTSNGETAESKRTKAYYSGLYNDFLKKLFVFQDFDIYVAMCGTENAFSSPDILICNELNNRLFMENVPAATLFIFLHEAAHSLLNVWDYPLFDNEDAADELATVLLFVTSQQAAAMDAAKWWANSGTKEEALSKLWLDDRHTVSPQRARNIIKWVNDEDKLTRRWLHLLVPKMTDKALSVIMELDDEGAYRELAQQEITKRQAVSAE